MTVGQLRRLLRDLSSAPKTIQRGTRAVMRSEGSQVLADARANASWSSRIPRAMRLQVTLSGSNPGVVIRVDRNAAPHGRVYEGMVGATFRHPVFEQPNRPTVWVAEDARPYLVPAATAAAPRLQRAVATAASQALSENNL
ncbi:hypothetical protein [Pseudactinotalea suaedae]